MESYKNVCNIYIEKSQKQKKKPPKMNIKCSTDFPGIYSSWQL